MQRFATFTDTQRDELRKRLSDPDIPSPYADYRQFSQAVAVLPVPDRLAEIGARIQREREDAVAGAHVLGNCPVDEVVPELGNDDPVSDKYARKKTFVAEAFLEMFARCTGTPLLAYGSRNNGDFFTDVVAINRYHGQQTGFSDSELVYHNDRTAHSVRADYIALLGMRCPEEDLVYTGFVDGRSLLEQLDERDRQVLRQSYFMTPFDVFSRDTNSRQIRSDDHPILENDCSFRYLDATTTVAPDSPPEAKDALLAMRDALIRAPKQRHRLRDGELLTFANQDGLHNRDRVEINDVDRARSRWLLKTYSFRNDAAAERHADRWLDGVRGRVAD